MKLEFILKISLKWNFASF